MHTLFTIHYTENLQKRKCAQTLLLPACSKSLHTKNAGKIKENSICTVPYISIVNIKHEYIL